MCEAAKKWCMPGGDGVCRVMMAYANKRWRMPPLFDLSRDVLNKYIYNLK
jgi:hypothetical protein